MTGKNLLLATFAGTIVSIISGAIILGLILNAFQATHSIHYEGLMKDTEN